MEILITYKVRLSGIVRQWANPMSGREITVDLVLFYTHASISCANSNSKPEGNPQTAIWNMTQDSQNLAHTCGLTFKN